MTHTRTYALVGVSDAAYREIERLLREAGYGRALVSRAEGDLIDMDGLALRRLCDRCGANHWPADCRAYPDGRCDHQDYPTGAPPLLRCVRDPGHDGEHHYDLGGGRRFAGHAMMGGGWVEP